MTLLDAEWASYGGLASWWTSDFNASTLIGRRNNITHPIIGSPTSEDVGHPAIIGSPTSEDVGHPDGVVVQVVSDAGARCQRRLYS
jgi:hypothetical protein